MNTPETVLCSQDEVYLSTLLTEIEAARETDPMHALHLCRRAHELACTLGEAGLAAERLLEVAELEWCCSQYARAEASCLEALAQFRATGHRAGEARALGTLGIIYGVSSRLEQSIGRMLEALHLARELGDQATACRCLCNLGNAFCEVGDYAGGLDYYLQGLAAAQDGGFTAPQANTLSNIGNTRCLLGQHEGAVTDLQEALRLARQLGDRRLEAHTLNVFMLAELGLGQLDAAHATAERALGLIRQVGGAVREEVLLLLDMGKIYLARGEAARSKAHYEHTAGLADALGAPLLSATARLHLGEALLLGGQSGPACEVLAATLAIAEEAGLAPEVSAAHELLAQAHERVGNFQAALQQLRLHHHAQQQLLGETQRRHTQVLLIQHEIEQTRQAAEAQRQLNERLSAANATLTGTVRALEREREQRNALLTRLGEQTERLDRLAHHDELTNLPNRRHAIAALARLHARARSEARALSVALIDLDRFKHVNDTYSHAVGDEVLRIFGTLLRRHVGEQDAFGRLGGEEFVLALFGAGEEAARQRLEALRADVANFDWASVRPDLRVTVSVGVCTFVHDGAGGTAPETLLAIADKRLYQAKAQGRNRVVW